MPLDDPLYRGQADADAGELIQTVQALERLKEQAMVRHVESGTVICDTDRLSPRDAAPGDTNDGVPGFSREFPGVIKQMQDGRFNHGWVAGDRKPALYFNHDLTLRFPASQAFKMLPRQG